MSGTINSYQDVRTKTVNWCSKLLSNGLMNNDQYNQCIANFNQTNTGILPPDFKIPRTGINYNYALYNKSPSDLANSSGSLSSKLNDSNNNTDVNHITNSNGSYLAETANSQIYFVNNINDPNNNQNDISWTLLQQSNTTQYAILSPHGHYLVANADYTISSNGSAIGPSSLWNITRIDNNILVESVMYAKYYLTYNINDGSIGLIYDKNEHSAWTLYPQIATQSYDNSNSSIADTYNAQQTQIMSAIYNVEKQLLILQTIVDILTQLRANVQANYDTGFNYISSQLTQLTTNGSGSGGSMSGIPDSDSNIVKNKITAAQTSALADIDASIANYNQQINTLRNENYIEVYGDYDTLTTQLLADASNASSTIESNNTIIDRQNAMYNDYNKNYAKADNKLKNTITDDERLAINMNILSSSVKSNNTYLKILPVIIILLICGIVILAYFTYRKFKRNVLKEYV